MIKLYQLQEPLTYTRQELPGVWFLWGGSSDRGLIGCSKRTKTLPWIKEKIKKNRNHTQFSSTRL